MQEDGSKYNLYIKINFMLSLLELNPRKDGLKIYKRVAASVMESLMIMLLVPGMTTVLFCILEVWVILFLEVVHRPYIKLLSLTLRGRWDC
jgi:hypothetical protein